MAKPKTNDDAELIKEWSLSPAATLGSSVRAKGILLEIRARLALAARKSLHIEAGVLTLAIAETAKGEFRAASAVVSNALEGIESLPVIPREIQDILTISTTERHRWLNDGRLPSAGTRTVKLRGRARKITFHVFDPRVVEDILDRDLVTVWREEDAEAAAENRRRAALKAKLTRSLRSSKRPSTEGSSDASRPKLSGWEEFGRDGLLR
ncbi:hypothetical protein J2W42_000925 [Rhizobium tibeticum]|uniref:hypothetical protein n=1 Tax=Rhizobium tibeticum TaxID=501024 RepID=UPI00278A0598|nr:hypothetical protein [Rhizobium tibeticum]MDP9808087.1 hypothetical protein [Rhizobium tibeticum]